MEETARSIGEVIGANLRARRAGRGLTQPDVAEAMRGLGMPWHPPTVSKAEDGSRDLTVREIYALAYVLGASWQELVDPLTVNDDSDVELNGQVRSAVEARAILHGVRTIHTRFTEGQRTDRVIGITHSTDAIIEEGDR